MYRTPIKKCSSTFGSCECTLQENHFEDHIDSSGITWDDNFKMKPSILEEEYYVSDPFGKIIPATPIHNIRNEKA